MRRSVKTRKNTVQGILRDERGVVAVIFAIMLPVFVALAALSIDMSYAYKTRNVTQVTASAAALAGVSQLVAANENDDPNDDDADGNDSEDYRREAIEYVYRNMSPTSHGNVVSAACGSYNSATGEAGTDDLECDDIKAGHWNGTTFFAWDDDNYVPENMDIDALQVRTHRAEANANALPLFFAGALGLVETNINTAAVATTGGGSISNACIIALNNEPGEDETFYMNGNGFVYANGCDIRVDQCCNGPGCTKGALHQNGSNPVMQVVDGEIDVCGTVYKGQDVSVMDPEPACTDSSEDKFLECAKAPSKDLYDPMTDYAEDNDAAWDVLAEANCDFMDFEMDRLLDPTYEYSSPDAAVQDPITGQWTFTLYPGVYCSDGTNNAKAIKSTGLPGDPKIVFANTYATDAGGDWTGYGWNPAEVTNNESGVFVIKNGKMDITSSGADISCVECGFFLTGPEGTVDWTGNNTYTLTASSDPNSPLHTLLIYQDADASRTPEDQIVKIHGGNDGSYYGAIYVPNADISLAGNTTSDRPGSDCFVIIADEIEVEGGAYVNAESTCSDFGGVPFGKAPLFFKLVN